MMEYTKDYYVRDTTTVEGFTEAVRNTLQYWLDIHTDRESWATGFLLDYSVTELLEESPILENNYFSFDWKNAATRHEAERIMNNYRRCSLHGELIDFVNGETCHLGENEDDEPDYETLDESDIDELTDYIREMEGAISEYSAWTALVQDGFEAYTKGIWSYINGYVEEVTDAINQIDEAESNAEHFQAVLWATHLMHINGNIVKDYGGETGLEWKQLDEIQKQGPESYFGQEALDKYYREV